MRRGSKSLCLGIRSKALPNLPLAILESVPQDELKHLLRGATSFARKALEAAMLGSGKRDRTHSSDDSITGLTTDRCDQATPGDHLTC